MSALHFLGKVDRPEQSFMINEQQQQALLNTLLQGRDEGVFRFDDLSITNQLMFMTLNSPIFWYSPRVGETRADVEVVAKKVVDYALGGLSKRREESA